MNTHVDCAAPLYFRCHRLAATITPHQCRINRERCEALAPLVDLDVMDPVEVRAPCFHCPQAAQMDSGTVRFFTLPQVVAGHALRQAAAGGLPCEVRIGAQPTEPQGFTSAFWVPEWDF